MQKVGKKWVKCGLKVGGFDKALNGVIWGEGIENRRFCKEKGAVTSSLERLFFLTWKITGNYLFGGSLLFWHFIVSNSQYHSIPVSITRHSPENLYNNTNPYKLLWTGEKRNFIEQDPNTGVYHKTAHYYEVYPKHAA